MTSRSFLTDQQIKILRLRARGMRQSEIAELLGTSRANVSILERRALEKIEKARNTLLIWQQINSKVSVEVMRGDDIFEVPERLFRKADRIGVKVPHSTAKIIAFLVEHAPVEDRLAKRDFTLFLDSNDRLRVSECILEDFDEIGKNKSGKDAVKGHS